MLQETIEGKWVKSFTDVFRLCAVKPGEVVAILSETQSRPILPRLSELALHQFEARPFHVIVCSPELIAPCRFDRPEPRSPSADLIRSSARLPPAGWWSIAPSKECCIRVSFPAILAGGARLMMISNEHPEVLERTKPTRRIAPRVRRGMEFLNKASRMRVRSEAGTDLDIRVAGAPARGAPGFVDRPGRIGYWPAGLCLCFPTPGSVNGTLVLAPGDVNLTFKRYIETPVRFTIENDYVTRIDGDGLDAELTRSYYEAWDDREAYATSHVGWGMNQIARWDAMTMYDRTQINGTEQRAFAGNFLFSTGANETANRFTACHFDFPMRNCTVDLDEKVIVDHGRLCKELS